MTSTVDMLTIDCAEAGTMGVIRSAALGDELEDEDEQGSYLSDPAGRGWPLYFQIVPEGTSTGGDGA